MGKIKLFIQNFGVLTITILAFLQPWIAYFYRKFFKKGNIDMFKSGTMDIGYSGFGPTIGLNGTLRCLNQDFFVQSMTIELTKEKDHSKHMFEWLIFRSQKATLKGEESEFELAYSFMVDTRQPRRYNILFSDVTTQKEITTALSSVREAWEKSMRQNYAKQPLTFNPLPYYNNEFSKTAVHVDTFTTLDRICYWEKGRYLITLEIQTSKPDKVIKRKWGFQLTDNDVRSLRLNVVKVLRDTCAIQAYGTYNFANVKYEEIP